MAGGLFISELLTCKYVEPSSRYQIYTHIPLLASRYAEKSQKASENSRFFGSKFGSVTSWTQ